MMGKKKNSRPRKERFTLEAALHLIIHFLGILLLLWLMIVPPLAVSVVIIILEVAQMKYFGYCFLTAFAHKRGYMRGMTYWEYVAYLFGAKNPKRADKTISLVIELAIVGILVGRFIQAYFSVM